MEHLFIRDFNYSKGFIIQFIPIFIILLILIIKNNQKQSISSILISFCLGISLHYPLDLLIHLAQTFQYTQIQNEKTIFFYTAFFRAAYLEESLKFIVIYYFCLKYQTYEKPNETFLYAVAVALGFAVYENLIYFKFFGIGLEKRLIVIFAHVGFALLMSIFLSKSMFHTIQIFYQKRYIIGPLGIFHPMLLKYKKNNQKFYFSKRIAVFLSLALPILFHGLWNILLMLKLFDYHQYLVYFNFIFIFIIILYLRYSSPKQYNNFEKRSELPDIDVVLNFIYVLILTLVTIFFLGKYLS